METSGAAARSPERPRFDPANILWFFGGFVAAGAAQTVLTRVHPSARGLWILLGSLAFLAAFAALAAVLLRVGWPVAGGVLAATAVTFVAPGTVGLERLLGVWRPGAFVDPLREFEGPYLAVALATAAAGLACYAVVRFPFVLAIVAGAVWAAGQLLLPVFVARPSLADHANAEIATGLVLIGVGAALDRRRERRDAFWWYVFGLVSLAVGLAYHAFRHSSWGWLLILASGALLLLAGTALRRATWAVFGVAGVFAPIAHYLDVWFGSLGTAFALAAFGLALLGLGIAARLAPGAPFVDT
jgi:hypothetical protein